MSDELLRELYRGCKVDSRTLAQWACFGWKREDTNIGGPQTWYRPVFDDDEPRVEYNGERYSKLTTPGWRGHAAFCCPGHFYVLTCIGCGYVLKYIEPDRNPRPHRIWAERQTSISYFGEADTWIFISPSVEMQLKLDARTSEISAGKPIPTFWLHLGFLNAATANWKPYLAYLTHETNEQVRLYDLRKAYC